MTCRGVPYKADYTAASKARGIQCDKRYSLLLHGMYCLAAYLMVMHFGLPALKAGVLFNLL